MIKHMNKKFLRPLFLINLLFFVYFELLFFITLFNYFYIEVLLIQPIYCFFFIISCCKTFKVKNWKRRLSVFYIIFFLVLIPLLFTKKHIKIEKKNDLHYTFWCKTENIPIDDDLINTLNKNNIDLIISLKKHHLTENITQKIENLIDNNIIIYINLGVSSFANINNYDEILEFFYVIKEQDFYNEIEGFTIDAEPSIKTINNFPSLKQIENAYYGYKQLINEIHLDNKTIYIVKNIEFGCIIDTALDNIYHLKLEWDKEITMIYRISKGGNYRLFTDFEMYNNIKFFSNNDIMLGSFDARYEYDDFIIDLTIYSNFGKDEVYLYYLDSFLEYFEIERIKEIEVYDIYFIEYRIFEAINQFFYHYFLDIVNLFAFFL